MNRLDIETDEMEIDVMNLNDQGLAIPTSRPTLVPLSAEPQSHLGIILISLIAAILLAIAILIIFVRKSRVRVQTIDEDGEEHIAHSKLIQESYSRELCQSDKWKNIPLTQEYYIGSLKTDKVKREYIDEDDCLEISQKLDVVVIPAFAAPEEHPKYQEKKKLERKQSVQYPRLPNVKRSEEK